jgi:hypothetical protein
MNSDTRLSELLRDALPPPHSTEPSADLWPRVRDRVERDSKWPPVHDWILTAAVVVLCLYQPSLMRFLLLHF